MEPDLEDSADDAVDGGPLAAPVWSPPKRGARVTTLANGLTVIAVRRPGLPFVSMVLGFHGDPEPGEAPGIRAALRSYPALEPAPQPESSAEFST